MKSIYPLFLAAGSFLLLSCAPMPVKIVNDKNFEFTTFHNFDVLPNDQDDLQTLKMSKSEFDQIVRDTITEELAGKGYHDNRETPDFLVAYYFVDDAKTDVYIVNRYYGNLGYSSPATGSSTRDSQNLQETIHAQGILIIDLIDVKSKQRIWQGYLTSRFDISQSEDTYIRRLRNAVIKIISFVPVRNNA